MPALAKTAAATALALALVGGGSAALSQPTTAPDSHTGYVQLITLTKASAPEILSGQVACEPAWHEQVWEAFSGRPACRYEGYAYAYPADQLPPWQGLITSVEDTYYTDETGSTWHVTEIVYRAAQASGEAGGSLVKAMASELLPPREDSQGRQVNYALPVDASHLEDGPSTLKVDVGPAPPASGTVEDDTLSTKGL